ncbi:MAG: hypothetical protein ACFFCS_23275, partial [Candidatus Hodarchaeota archaeon]
IIKKYIEEVFYTDPLFGAIDGLWRVDIMKRRDGGVNVLFEFLFNEHPFQDDSKQDSYWGCVDIDPDGNLVRTSKKKHEDLLDWEANLKIGDFVDARFTKEGRINRYIGEIIKVNLKSVRVKPADIDAYKPGLYIQHFPYREPFTIPKRSSSKFSYNNGVYPLATNFFSDYWGFNT